MVGQTDIALVTIASTATARGVCVFIDSRDHLGHADFGHRALQSIAPAGAAHAAHQIAAAQMGKKLLQVGQGDTLSLRNSGQAYRAAGFVQREVQHSGYGVPAFGGKAHSDSLSTRTELTVLPTRGGSRAASLAFPSILVKYKTPCIIGFCPAEIGPAGSAPGVDGLGWAWMGLDGYRPSGRGGWMKRVGKCYETLYSASINSIKSSLQSGGFKKLRLTKNTPTP